MPNTPSEIAADRERRAKAIAEINVGYLFLISPEPLHLVFRSLVQSSPKCRDTGVGSERIRALLTIYGQGYLRACPPPPSSKSQENGSSETLNDSKHIVSQGNGPGPKTEMDRNRVSKKKKGNEKEKTDRRKQILDASKHGNGGDSSGSLTMPVRHKA